MVGRPWKRSQDFAGDQLAHRDLLAGVFPRQYLALSKETPWRVKEEMPLNGGQECGLGRPENEVIDDSRLLRCFLINVEQRGPGDATEEGIVVTFARFEQHWKCRLGLRARRSESGSRKPADMDVFVLE